MNLINSEHTLTSDLSPRDICLTLNRSDCNENGFYSFVPHMTKLIKQVKNNQCSYLVASQDMKTGKLTNSSFAIQIRTKDNCRSEYVPSHTEHTYQINIAMSKCRPKLKSGEECVLIFAGNKILSSAFVSQ